MAENFRAEKSSVLLSIAVDAAMMHRMTEKDSTETERASFAISEGDWWSRRLGGTECPLVLEIIPSVPRRESCSWSAAEYAWQNFLCPGVIPL